MSGVWLIGFRGSGKTTLGRLAAERLGLRFLDCDEELERRRGESILAFVRREGLARFREAEATLLAELSARINAEHKLLIATGGGVVEEARSRSILEASPWPKLYLDCAAETLWNRLEKSQDRREIGNLSSLEAVAALLETRRPFYEKIATAACKNQDISGCLPALEKLFTALSPA